MNNIQHKNLAAGRWRTLSFSEQMGNVGSEVSRAISWDKRGDIEQKEKALVRAFELLDLTIEDPRWSRFSRLKEILRTREVMADYFYGDNLYFTQPEKLEQYFYYFAFAARRLR
ncbi:hypothetical protein HZB94_03695 [Candidatus Falkowbacteria bacterium]|nr:hypothetical protein [Candidatus Falkowbacteria bacterium]